MKDKDGLLCLFTDRVDAVLMDARLGLKVISQVAVDYDNMGEYYTAGQLSPAR